MCQLLLTMRDLKGEICAQEINNIKAKDERQQDLSHLYDFMPFQWFSTKNFLIF